MVLQIEVWLWIKSVKQIQRNILSVIGVWFQVFGLGSVVFDSLHPVIEDCEICYESTMDLGIGGFRVLGGSRNSGFGFQCR